MDRFALGAWALALGLVLSALPAAAQQPGHDAEAREAFESGRRAFAEGRFEDALELFRHSYDLSGRVELLYDIGTSHDRLRHDREALEAFEQYLGRVPLDSPHRAEVRRRVEVLRASLQRESAQPPTPEETARADDVAAAPAPPSGAPPRDQGEDEGGSVLGAWWFWTIVGVVVAGGVLATVLVVQSEDETEPALGGTNGWTVSTLRFAP